VADPQSPYRRIAPAPVAKTKPRAVASRPETPEERDRREALELAGSRKKRFKLEAVIAGQELERARLTFGITMRALGAVLVALSFVTIGMHASAIADGARTIWVGRMGPIGLFVGPFLVIAGGGGAASKDSLPMWWRVGIGITAVIGMIVGHSFEVDLSLFAASFLR
jgi:hypothetical protein